MIVIAECLEDLIFIRGDCGHAALSSFLAADPSDPIVVRPLPDEVVPVVNNHGIPAPG